MEFSIYSSAFNLVKNNFNYNKTIQNFCDFAEEVIICVNTSEDNTLEELKALELIYPNLIIVTSDYSYEDPLFDGKIKNKALSQTTKPWKIGLDMDELVVSSQKAMWSRIAEAAFDGVYRAVLIPSINLFGDITKCKGVGAKWYLHTDGLFRGVVKFANKEDGKIDIEKSDTCELVDVNGNLVETLVLPKSLSHIKDAGLPYVFHLGYLDIENRININKFWKPVWENRAGREVTNIILDKEGFEGTETFEHNLELWK